MRRYFCTARTLIPSTCAYWKYVVKYDRRSGDSNTRKRTQKKSKCNHDPGATQCAHSPTNSQLNPRPESALTCNDDGDGDNDAGVGDGGGDGGGDCQDGHVAKAPVVASSGRDQYVSGHATVLRRGK